MVLTRATAGQTVLVLVGLGLVALGLLAWVGYIKIGLGRQLFLDRRRNLEMRAAVREVGEGLRRAASLEEVWAAVKRAARALGASCAALTLVDRNGVESATTVRSVGFDEAGSDLLRARYSLLGERPDDGAVELGWTDGRTSVERDTEIAVELLCEHVLAAVVRLDQDQASEGARGGEVVRLRGHHR
ncbi:MAG TPA: hypothetical protein VFR85_07580 [Anaeromyxobacteraceae bacterium]|nr:hypothetical protein [Anaeromyxobacteraceae bacterium]